MSRPEETSPPADHSSATTSALGPTPGATPTSTSKDATISSSSTPTAPQPGQSAYPTLTDKDPSSSGPATGDIDSTHIKSKDSSSSLPPPQISASGSSATHGDALATTEGSVSQQPQVNKADSIGSRSDSKLRLKGTQDAGPVSMSSQETSHPGAGEDVPVGDPSSEQAPKGGEQGGSNPLNEPTPKSKEDAEDPGTGLQYVKASGVAAQGGDFDASKPGAGVPEPFGYVLIC